MPDILSEPEDALKWRDFGCVRAAESKKAFGTDEAYEE